MNSQNNTVDRRYKLDDEADQLPGFRFHPTDEELVGFYLRRKVDKKQFTIELIKQIDIYKHDPWDLPKISSTPDKEGYFFCKRGRKYRNSIRPNRVTGSGFWKATGIDKPVYSQEGEDGYQCIGLKKTLVYYVGSAGKGTKTDWMMNEFRLPSKDSSSNSNATTTMPEAEVWTICRIFKRNVSYRKNTAEWREQSSVKSQSSAMEQPSSTIAYSMESNNKEETFISFENPRNIHHHNYKPQNSQYKKPRMLSHPYSDNPKPAVVDHINGRNQFSTVDQLRSTIANNPHESIASSSSYPNAYRYDLHELLTYESWDELRSIVDFASDTSLM